MKLVSRVEAKRLGLSLYYTGKPCRHGHVSQRAVTDGNCMSCRREQGTSWQTKNVGRSAAAAMFRLVRRKYPRSIVPGITMQDVLPYYVKAAELTSSGVPHEVDHRVPLGAGGKHHPDNLRVITMRENRSRPKETRAYITQLEQRVEELEAALADEQLMRRAGDWTLEYVIKRYMSPVVAQEAAETGRVCCRIMTGKEQILQQQLQ